MLEDLDPLDTIEEKKWLRESLKSKDLPGILRKVKTEDGTSLYSKFYDEAPDIIKHFDNKRRIKYLVKKEEEL